MRTSSRTVALALAALLTTQPLLAQPRPAGPPSSDVRSQLTDTARKAWDAARQLAEAKDYKGALVELQRAYQLSNNPRILFNVGALEKLQTHYARAVEAWERELREGVGKLTQDEAGEARRSIAIVQQFVTAIDVTANEADATLFIDDYPIGKTPFAGPVKIDVGKRSVRLSKDGFVDAVQTVDAASGQRLPVSFILEPKNRTAQVSVTVGGAPSATVFIDGKDMGPAPFKGDLTAERHTIEARSPGFVTVGQTVDVLYKQSMSLVLSLSQERHEGRLKVTAPEGAEIAVDERKVGSGTWEGLVSTTGGHQLVVTRPGFQTYSTEVFVADDQTREVDVPLNREVGTSWVAWGVGSLLVVTGGIVAGFFIFKPAQPSPFEGNLGLTTASHPIRFN